MAEATGAAAHAAAKPEREAAPATPAPAEAREPQRLLRTTMDVRWRDLDAFNHVNNSNYLTYLEEARLRWMMQLPGEWLDDHIAPLMAGCNVNYKRPIEWPEELVVELFVERIGTTSITIGHRILSAKDATVVYADGNVTMVWVDRRSGRPAPLPEAVRQACGA
ncbi:thioesterase family protein [Coralloluteibacterium stylophorae]|uniref:acyl-CoA thioesterase n=1 Tax=Coralloluteibacterium stylophorae TaxID=1776034 RepID=UPI003084041B